MRLMMIILFALLLTTVEAVAIEIPEAMITDIYFISEDAINGNGSFTTRSCIRMEGPHVDHRMAGQDAGMMLKELKHGSGTIDSEAQTFAERLNFTFIIDDYNITKVYASVWMAEDNSMTYSPVTIPIGTGYYAAHPISYDSTLKEKTCIKNYATETSMQHEILYAEAVDKDLEVLVKDKYYNNTGLRQVDVARTVMNVTEDVTDGRTHLGVLQGNTEDDDVSAWKDPVIDIQEVYEGTYHIDQKMSLYWPVERKSSTPDWLSCCYGGLDDVSSNDYVWMESEICI